MDSLTEIKEKVAQSNSFENWKRFCYVMPRTASEELAKEYARHVGKRIIQDAANRIENLDVIPEVITNIDIEQYID